MSQGVKNPRLHTVAVLAALVLSACGGGGGDDVADAPAPIGSAPAPSPAPGAPAPAPGPAPAPAPATVAVTADTQAQPNQRYEVRAAAGSQVAIRLPQQAQVGDTLSITGVTDSTWTIAQNAGQSVVTTNLTGNVSPGTQWTPRLGPLSWWWLTADAAGDVLLAGENRGSLFISTDGGANWNERQGDRQRIWIGADMTPTGSKMVAVAFADTMYISENRGETWQAVAQPGFAGLDWESVSISADGNTILASALNQPLQLSRDGGATWNAVAQVGSWRNVAISADGRRMVALDQGAQIHTSTDGGVTWQARTTGAGDWYRVAMSDDGQVIAAAERFDGGVWISRDGGQTFVRGTRGGTPIVADWTTVAVSADGQRIAATATGEGVLLSEDGGQTFAALPAPGTDPNWRSVAMSADGNMMMAATGGAVEARTPGQLYTSLGNRTAMGTLGAITGGQNQAIELEYLGNGRFGVRAASGGAFAIR